MFLFESVCEMCGDDCRDDCKVKMVDGAEMALCSDCAERIEDDGAESEDDADFEA